MDVTFDGQLDAPYMVGSPSWRAATLPEIVKAWDSAALETARAWAQRFDDEMYAEINAAIEKEQREARKLP